MKSPEGALRQARAEVAEQIPELAPLLGEDPYIIEDAVRESVVQQGMPVEVLTERDCNKTARHSIATFAIGELRRHLVTGKGREAQFKIFDKGPVSPIAVKFTRQTTSIFYRNRLGKFIERLRRTQRQGASWVEAYYSQGAIPETKWWSLAEKRYRELGQRAVEIDDGTDEFPPEAIDLSRALRTRAFATNVHIHAEFVKFKVPTKEDRARIAHDLLYVPTTEASVHAVEFAAANERPLREALDQTEVVERRGRAVLAYPNEKVKQQLFPRVEHLPTSTLKCPAHAKDTRQPRELSDLEHMLHAAINEIAAQDQF